MQESGGRGLVLDGHVRAREDTGKRIVSCKCILASCDCILFVVRRQGRNVIFIPMK